MEIDNKIQRKRGRRMKRSAPKTPKKYSIATAEEREQLLKALSVHCASQKKIAKPELRAAQIIRQCLNGETADGQMWKYCPPELKSRFMMFGFDLERMTTNPTWKRATRIGRGGRDKAAERMVGEILESSKAPRHHTSHIQHAASQLYGETLKEYNQRIIEFLRVTPDLNNPVDMQSLSMLVKMQLAQDAILSSILRHEKPPGGFSLEKGLGIEIDRLLKGLGLDRSARQRELSAIGAGTVADLSKRYQEYKNSEQFWKNETQWYVEEIAMLLRKMDRQFPDGTSELNEATFRFYTGISSKEARELVINPYGRNLNEVIENAKLQTEKGAKKDGGEPGTNI